MGTSTQGRAMSMLWLKGAYKEEMPRTQEFKKLDLLACNKLPGHTDTRKINPSKDPDGDPWYEDNSALGENSEQSSDSNRYETIRISRSCEEYLSIFLLDSSAIHNFVSLDFIKKHKLQHLLKADYGSIIFDNESKTKSGYYVDLKIKLGTSYTSTIRAYTGIKGSKHDLILGKL